MTSTSNGYKPYGNALRKLKEIRKENNIAFDKKYDILTLLYLYSIYVVVFLALLSRLLSAGNRRDGKELGVLVFLADGSGWDGLVSYIHFFQSWEEKLHMSHEEKIRPDEFDEELERLMNSPAKPSKKKSRIGFLKKKKFWIIAAVCAAGLFGVSKILGGGGQAIPAAAVTTPVIKDIQSRLSVSGPVEGTDSVDVFSQLNVEVLELLVKEGDKVTKGQPLAVLDDTDLKKEVEIARNDYELAVSTREEMNREAKNGYAKAVQDLQAAQANFNRTKLLYENGDVALVEYEAAQNTLNDARRQTESFTVKNGVAVAGDSYELQIEKARFAYEKKQEELADTVITAPIDGTVVRVNTKVGRYAANETGAAEPLFIIENLDVLEMEIQVSEYSIGKVSVGQDAEIKADILDGASVKGKVVSISPTGEEKGGGSTERVIPTTIRILDDHSKLIAGISARAEIVLEESKNALTVPSGTILSQDGETYIQAVEGGLIHWIPVDIGVEGDFDSEILPKDGETVSAETQIVVTPNPMFTEGMAVTPMVQ